MEISKTFNVVDFTLFQPYMNLGYQKCNSRMSFLQVEVTDAGHSIKSTKILILVVLRYYLYFFGILFLFPIIVLGVLFSFLLLFWDIISFSHYCFRLLFSFLLLFWDIILFPIIPILCLGYK